MAGTKAAQAEAAGAGPQAITFRTLTFTIPQTADWPLAVFEAFEDGKTIAAIRSLLGPAQWARFKALDPEPTMKDLEALTASISSAAGFDSPGE